MTVDRHGRGPNVSPLRPDRSSSAACTASTPSTPTEGVTREPRLRSYRPEGCPDSQGLKNAPRGRWRGLQQMIEEERYCIDILTQISATRAALDGVALKILEDHVQALCA